MYTRQLLCTGFSIALEPCNASAAYAVGKCAYRLNSMRLQRHGSLSAGLTSANAAQKSLSSPARVSWWSLHQMLTALDVMLLRGRSKPWVHIHMLSSSIADLLQTAQGVAALGSRQGGWPSRSGSETGGGAGARGGPVSI